MMSKDSLLARLRDLTSLDGVSGFEQDVVRYLRDALSDLAHQVEVDAMGNVYATVEGNPQGPHLLLEAHSDEIGAIVKSIDAEGFLRFDTLGGVIPAMLMGRRVRVRGHLGVIGVKSGHLQSAEEKERVLPSDDLYIDVGADGAAEVASMGIGIGDPIAYYSPLLSFTNENRVCGKSIDNRIGCAILLEVLALLKDEPLAGTLHVAVSVQEETGLRGATVAARRFPVEYAIVVDTFMAGGTPDVNLYREVPARIGHGPVLLLAHSSHVAHPAVNRYLLRASEACGVSLQPCTIVGKAATDSGAIHLGNSGVPTAGLGLARRYSHTPVCTLDLRDAVAAVRVLVQFARDMANHKDLGFLA